MSAKAEYVCDACGDVLTEYDEHDREEWVSPTMCPGCYAAAIETLRDEADTLIEHLTVLCGRSNDHHANLTGLRQWREAL